MKPSFIILLIIFPLAVAGQENKQAFSGGGKIGMAFSTLTPDYTDANGYKHQFSLTDGLKIGGFIQLPAGKNILIQPELFFIVKGGDEKVSFDSVQYTNYGPRRISYVELPINILAKLKAGTGFFLAGGGPSFAFSRKRYFDAGPRFDAGLNLLLGFQWPLGFLVNLNYTKGFSNTEHAATGVPKVTNSSFGICVGYAF